MLSPQKRVKCSTTRFDHPGCAGFIVCFCRFLTPCDVKNIDHPSKPQFEICETGNGDGAELVQSVGELTCKVRRACLTNKDLRRGSHCEFIIKIRDWRPQGRTKSVVQLRTRKQKFLSLREVLRRGLS